MLLTSEEFRDRVESALLGARDEAIFLSAFIKRDALDWLLSRTSVSNIKIVARWRLGDLVSGASDFACYDICRSHGIPFGISLSLHSKCYLIDSAIYVGSANLTSRGMALSQTSNFELGAAIVAGKANRQKLKSFLEAVTWIDDDLARLVQDDVEKSKANLNSESGHLSWSQEVRARLATSVTQLWVHELPFCTPADLIGDEGVSESRLHDFDLLGCSPDQGLDIEGAKRKFCGLKAFSWLTQALQDSGGLSFGGLSGKLHNAIIDDPAPYRREVKQLVSVLIEWARLYPEYFTISKPRHSTIIERTKNS